MSASEESSSSSSSGSSSSSSSEGQWSSGKSSTSVSEEEEADVLIDTSEDDDEPFEVEPVPHDEDLDYDPPPDLENPPVVVTKDLPPRDGYEDDEDAASDTSDESTEIILEEYVDEIDEGYYAPSKGVLVLLFLLVLGAAAGLGYGIYAAHESQQEDNGPTKIELSPTIAPGGDLRDDTAAPAPSSLAPTDTDISDGLPFLCNICPDDGSITLPDAVVPGLPNTPTCAALQGRADEGELSEAQCNLAQTLTLDPCGCVNSRDLPIAPPEFCTVCKDPEHVVRDPQGVIDVSSAGFPNIESLTCGQLDAFAQAGNIPDSFCPDLQSAAQEPCDCGILATCSICPEGSLVGNVDGVVDTTSFNITGSDDILVTCGKLQDLAEEGAIPTDSCPDLQAVTLEPCECTSIPPVSRPCPICPRGQIIQLDASVEFGGETITCAALQAIGNSGQLDEIQCSSGLQVAGQASCNCAPNPQQQEILDLLESVIGVRVTEPATAEFLAAEYLLYEDPRFHGTSSDTTTESIVLRGRRDLQDSDTPECLICPEGQSMTESDAAIPEGSLPEAFSNFEGTTCANLMRASAARIIPEDFCADLQALTLDLCECLDDTLISAPTLNPNPPDEEPLDPPSDESIGVGLVDLFSLEDSELVQRYLMILLYYQTSTIGETPWTTGCGPLSSDPKEEGQTTACWLSAFGECTWAGVMCNEDRAVTSLELAAFGLNGEFPTALLEMDSLIRLDLYQNLLQGPIPKVAADQWQNLEYLNLNLNEFEGVIPESIYSVPPNLLLAYLDGGPGGNEVTGSVDCSLRASDALTIGIDCTDEAVICTGECCQCCGLFRECLEEETTDEITVR